MHAVGARVAVHSTLSEVAPLVRAGIDSIEHGPGLDDEALKLMARTGAAWTPTLCALFSLMGDASLSQSRRTTMQEAWDRMRMLLPLAVKLGVPVLAGTDVVGTIAREVGLLSKAGLAPHEALSAATTWPRRFLGEADIATADFVTYVNDPREDPAELARPSAVFIGGIRVR